MGKSNMGDMNEALFAFIASSPSQFHTIATLSRKLQDAGYKALHEHMPWKIEASGAYFVTRNMSSMIAFRIPEGKPSGFQMCAAHGDSPSFQIKENPELESAGVYVKLSTEKYGGMICSTWMDRPLSVAGRVVVSENGRIVSRLVNADRDLLVIPSVAIHMNRGVNEGASFNAAVDMYPLLGSESTKGSFRRFVADLAGTSEDAILGTDLFLYNRMAGTKFGLDGEFISAPRLDDLQCAFGCLKGFLQADKPKKATVLCVFDNEEVGSGTRQGADSGFLDDMLSRAWHALGRSDAQYRAALAGSFMVSADNAHAIHPNHPEFADRSERPVMNGGIVIKFNASMSYTTDGLSAAVFSELCRAAEVPVQRYANRPDLRGGSTLGHISLAHVSVPTLDIGLAQLAMHSSYETAGAKDTEYLVRAARAFYDSAYRVSGERIALN